MLTLKVGESYSLLLDGHFYILTLRDWDFAVDTLCHQLPRSRASRLGFSTDSRIVKAVVKREIQKEKKASKISK